MTRSVEESTPIDNPSTGSTSSIQQEFARRRFRTGPAVVLTLSSAEILLTFFRYKFFIEMGESIFTENPALLLLLPLYDLFLLLIAAELLYQPQSVDEVEAQQSGYSSAMKDIETYFLKSLNDMVQSGPNSGYTADDVIIRDRTSTDSSLIAQVKTVYERQSCCSLRLRPITRLTIYDETLATGLLLSSPALAQVTGVSSRVYLMHEAAHAVHGHVSVVSDLYSKMLNVANNFYAHTLLRGLLPGLAIFVMTNGADSSAFLSSTLLAFASLLPSLLAKPLQLFDRYRVATEHEADMLAFKHLCLQGLQGELTLDAFSVTRDQVKKRDIEPKVNFGCFGGEQAVYLIKEELHKAWDRIKQDAQREHQARQAVNSSSTQASRPLGGCARLSQWWMRLMNNHPSQCESEQPMLADVEAGEGRDPVCDGSAGDKAGAGYGATLLKGG